jgi:hypothetical protein
MYNLEMHKYKNLAKYFTLTGGFKVSTWDEIYACKGRINFFDKHNLKIHASVMLVNYNSTKGKLTDMFINIVT